MKKDFTVSPDCLVYFQKHPALANHYVYSFHSFTAFYDAIYDLYEEYHNLHFEKYTSPHSRFVIEKAFVNVAKYVQYDTYRKHFKVIFTTAPSEASSFCSFYVEKGLRLFLTLA